MSEKTKRLVVIDETLRMIQEEYLTEIDKLERRIQSLEKTIENLTSATFNLVNNHYATKDYVKTGFLSHLKQKH